MDPWVILGLEPYSDFKRVRKAYAEKLKRTHPEEDPEGFMLLREAYEYLRDSLNRPEGVELWWKELSEATAASEPEPKSTPVRKRPVRERAAPLAPDWDVPQTVSRLMDRVRSIYRDDELQGSLDAWRSVLEDDVLWRIDVRLEFGNALFELLAAGKTDLGWAVWLLLEQEFRWRERGPELESDFDVDSVNATVGHINQAFEERPPFYLRFRELFTLTESRDPSLDDRIPFLGVWVHHFGWFALAATLLVIWFG